MVNQVAVGIDLGTSNSAISIYETGDVELISDPSSKTPIVPSIVALNKRDELLVGENASSYINSDDYCVKEVKRLMGSKEVIKLKNEEYRPEEISAIILKKLKQNAENTLGIEINDVVISVPANFEDAARQATMAAGELAGLNVIRLINEPTAAALSFGVDNIETEEQILVFDWGGGTLDITVLEMFAGVLDVQASSGNPNLGGKDFDQALLDLAINKFRKKYPNATVNKKSKKALQEKVEETKKVLSESNFADIQVPFFAFEDGNPIDLDIEISRREFESVVKPLLNEAKELIQKVLANEGVDFEAIDRVLLVGGTTYIPSVRRIIKEVFNQEARADVDPDLAVAMGTAIESAQAQDLIDNEEGLIKTDVAPYGLGTNIIEQVGNQFMEVYDPLIEPNTTIPYSTKREYTLLHSEQEEVILKLYQDHNGGARTLDEVIDTGIEAKISEIPKLEDGRIHPVEVEFSYDVNGIAKIKARIPTTGQNVDLVYKNTESRLVEDEKNEALNRINNLWEQNPKAKRYEGLIDKAEKLIVDLEDYKKEQLDKVINNLKKALTEDSNEKIESFAEDLTDLLFDFENDLEG